MKHSRNLIVGLTVIAFALGALLHCWYYVATILPLDPEADAYANTVAFQILAWSMTRLPMWILGLFVAIVLETKVFRLGAQGKRFLTSSFRRSRELRG